MINKTNEKMNMKNSKCLGENVQGKRMDVKCLSGGSLASQDHQW